jgi:RimJ/RimL family protein N-acetyltransferase
MFPDALTTARLRLRPVAMADAPAILDAYARDAEVTRYLTWRPHRTLGDTEAYLAACLEMAPASARVYAVTGRDDGALLGCLHLRRPVLHRVECGYVLARSSWGTGLMTEVLRAAVAWALAEPGVFRVGAVCDVDNPASARVMEKAGLVREGLLGRWMVHPNVSALPRDCFIYGLAR